MTDEILLESCLKLLMQKHCITTNDFIRRDRWKNALALFIREMLYLNRESPYFKPENHKSGYDGLVVELVRAFEYRAIERYKSSLETVI